MDTDLEVVVPLVIVVDGAALDEVVAVPELLEVVAEDTNLPPITPELGFGAPIALFK